MSTPGLSGKSHGDKNASGGKKYQAVNINSVYSGKSLVGSKSSAAPKHGGLQSLGKATVVARRMPPPANLPSLKSESTVGQDIAVNIVPSGAAGWATQQQPQSTTTSPEYPDSKSFFDGTNKKTPSDGISLRPSGGSGMAGGTKGSSTTANGSNATGGASSTPANATVSSTSTNQPQQQQQHQQASTTNRPTWSTRIGTSNSASNFFAAQNAQDYPKMDTENADGKMGSTAPSLRPQRSGTWKSGGGHGTKHQGNEPENGRERSRSASPSIPPDHAAASQEHPPPFIQSGFSQRQGGYQQQHHPVGPYPYTLYSPQFHLPHPQYGVQQDYRYGNHPNGPAPPPPMIQQGRHGAMGPQQSAPGKQGDHGRGMHQPIEHYRSSGPPPPIPPRGADYAQPYGNLQRPPQQSVSEKDYGPPAPRDGGRGERWNAPAAAYYHSREQDMRYRENTVWSDDDVDENGDRRYGRGDGRRNKNEKEHAYSDSDDRYGDVEWTGYDEQRGPGPIAAGVRPPPPIRPGMGYPPPNMKSIPYPPPVGPVMHGRDGRYGPMPVPIPPSPMQPMQRHPYGGYMPPYDQRHMPPPPMNYGPQQPPHQYARNRGPHDIEAEEEEEIARQQQQQYAREAAMERSKQKRRQQSSQGGGAVEHHAAGDVRYQGGGDGPGTDDYDDSEADRSSSRESYQMRQGKRPHQQPVVPPRFVRQGDSRPLHQAPPMGPPYNYGRQYPHGGGPGPNQYDPQHAHLGQADGGYYDKRSPRQAPQAEIYGANYESNRRFEGHYRDEKRGYAADDVEQNAPNQGRRSYHEEPPAPAELREKPLKRPDSKESLSSRSDQSSNKGDKNTGSSGSSTAARPTKLWPSITVKEEEDRSADTKVANLEDDNEEDQKFETLSKPRVVVKRTIPPAAVEKPKESTTPVPAVDSTSSTQKLSTQTTTPAAKEDAKVVTSSTASATAQKPQNQHTMDRQQSLDKDDPSKKNVWEQRKEQFEKQDPATTPEGSQPKDEELPLNEERFKNDQHGYYDDYSSVSSTRGRGLVRGRGRREFVSSRRLHGHSVGAGGGSALKRGGHRGTSSNWESGYSSGGRRRGGSFGTGTDHQVKRTFEETVEKPQQPKEDKGNGETNDAPRVEKTWKAEERENDDSQKRGYTENEEDSGRGDGAARGRGSVRGGRRGSSNYAATQDWNRKGYGNGGGGAVYSRTRGGYGQRGYDENAYQEEDAYDYGSGGYYDSYRRYNQASNRDRNTQGQRTVPPRFREHEQRGGNAYGSSGGDYRQHYGSSRRGATGSRNRDNLNPPTKSSSGNKRENQSEGNDEWETASESSDVAERHKPEQPKDGESLDKRKQPPIGPKSFSSQRRAPDRRRGGHGISDTRGNVHRRGQGREGSEMHRSGEKSSDADHASQTGSIMTADQKLNTGSKNAIVASHQASSNNRADAMPSEYPARNPNRRSLKKDEKPAPKPGALATVDINNIAGVVVIDDQPDIPAASENQDGFQEVVSRKRLKKDVHLSDEKDRKSQSPSNRARVQSHSGSVGGIKGEKNGKKSVTSGTPASISANASARSSAGDSSGAMTATQTASPWERKLSNHGQNMPPASMNRQVDQQHYRGNNRGGDLVMGAETAIGQQQQQSQQIPSKTGVEIWGTPDPVPFAGVNEQTNSKCVARPAKAAISEAAVRPKSVEFIADSLNKGIGEASGMKLDFTFDESLGPFRDPKQNAAVDHSRRNVDLDLDESQSDNSPSADQLSEKIASVKKVWDGVQSSAEREENSNQQTSGGPFFGAASDAETAAIVSSAASLVSAAVLQSVHPDQTQQHHPSGYDGESTTKADVSGVPQAMTSTGSSSKMEGPNVAKVRPQQMLVEPPTSASHIIVGQDEFGNSGLLNAGYVSGSPTPLFAFNCNNANSLFSAQFATAKGDFGINATQQPFAPFPSAAASNRSIFGQQGAFVLPPNGPVSQGLELPFGTQPRNTLFGTDQGTMLFGAPPTATYLSQPLRGPSAMLSAQQGPQSKASSMNVYGNVQGSYLLQDMSLFSHPPPSTASLVPQQPPPVGAGLLAARATPCSTATQQSSAANFYFTQPPPPASVSIAQPPPMAGTAILQAPMLQSAAPNLPLPLHGKMASFSSLTSQQPPPPFGWGGSAVPPPQPKQLQSQPMLPVGRKLFNPTIGPPNSQKINLPGTAPGMMGLPTIGHLFGASTMGQPQPLTISTNPASMAGMNAAAGNLLMGIGAAGSNFGRRGGSSGSSGSGQQQVKGQNVSSNIDQAKRDGDLLQQMDKFINSTGEEENTGTVHGSSNMELEDTSAVNICTDSAVAAAFQQVN